MSRLRFKVGEVAILTPGGHPSFKRWLGNGCDCTILQIGTTGGDQVTKFDYRVLVHDGSENGTPCACDDWTLRKKRRPRPPREQPQVTQLKRDIDRWMKMPANSRARKRAESDAG